MSAQNDDDFDKDLEDAAATMDSKLAAKLTLSADLISSICPTPVDKQGLQALMAAVNAATSDAEAQAQLMRHAESCGMVLVRLIKTVALA